MQSALEDVMAVGQAAGGGVQVTINGNQQALGVLIQPEMLTDKTRLEVAVKDAFNDAHKKIQKDMAATMKNLGGLEALKKLGL